MESQQEHRITHQELAKWLEGRVTQCFLTSLLNESKAWKQNRDNLLEQAGILLEGTSGSVRLAYDTACIECYESCTKREKIEELLIANGYLGEVEHGE